MKKNVLIPTDFSIGSLNLVKYAAQQYDGQEMEILLVYSSSLSDSITDLLFYSPEKIMNGLITEDFKQACSILRNRFTNIVNDLKVQNFHGRTLNAFQSFIHARRIEEAFIPKSYALRMHKNSFDPIPFIRKSGLPFTEVFWLEKTGQPEKDQLAELFLD